MHGHDRQLLRLLLSRDFWLAHRDRVSPLMFEGEARTIFETACAAHAKYDHDLSPAEVAGLLRAEHPTLPRAALNACHEILTDIGLLEPISADVAADVLATAWRLQVFREIAEVAVQGTQGTVPDLEGIRRIVERAGDGFAPADDFDRTPSDLDAILAAIDNEPRWKFNIETVARQLPGMSGGELLLFLARPETGKSAAPISLSCAPGGWLDQGAKVAIFCNEEPGIRTKLRAVTAAVQKPVDWIRENRSAAQDAWERLAGRLEILDGQPESMTMARIDAYARRHKPDIIVMDQLDKVRVSGKFEAGHERLREVYTQARELAKRNGLLAVGLGQAAVEAEGKTIVTPSMAEGSKTGKFAEADVIIGIGKHAVPQTAVLDPDWNRWWTVGKNKISAWTGTIITTLNPATSTYLA